jgi:hypothetical protein
LRCRSPPGAKPFCARPGERPRPSGKATFLKVMVHSTSSPANTVAFFHCTNTRMFEADMVRSVLGAGCGVGSSSSGFFVKRHGACRIWTAEEWQRPQLKGGSDGATREGDVKLLRHHRPRRWAPAGSSKRSGSSTCIRHVSPHGIPSHGEDHNNTQTLHVLLDLLG